MRVKPRSDDESGNLWSEWESRKTIDRPHFTTRRAVEMHASCCEDFCHR